MTDQLSPEDRALHDAFFEAYRVKYNELAAAAGDGAEISLDECTVHAIRTMTAREIELRVGSARVLWGDADQMMSAARGAFGDLYPAEAASIFETLVKCFGEILEGRVNRALTAVMGAESDGQPRIVSAVGVGVKVRPPEGSD